MLELAREIRDAKLRIKPACAARTHLNDIQPIVEISQKLGMPIEVMAFIGSSPIRLYAEDWDLDRMLKRSAEAIDLAVKNGLPVTYVTEDTTRSRPEVLATLFKNAIEHGAQPPVPLRHRRPRHARRHQATCSRSTRNFIQSAWASRSASTGTATTIAASA